jgi:hypothetical protein
MKDVIPAEAVTYRDHDFPNPAGLPRPQVAGLPFPWVTPMIDGVPRFREIDRVRAEMCRALWGCQVCGEDLGATAWVVVREAKQGAGIVSSSAMHRQCLDLAVRHCPRLADPGSGYAFTEVSLHDIESRVTPTGPRDDRQPRERWYLQGRAASFDFRSRSEVMTAWQEPNNQD